MEVVVANLSSHLPRKCGLMVSAGVLAASFSHHLRTEAGLNVLVEEVAAWFSNHSQEDVVLKVSGEGVAVWPFNHPEVGVRMQNPVPNGMPETVLVEAMAVYRSKLASTAPATAILGLRRFHARLGTAWHSAALSKGVTTVMAEGCLFRHARSALLQVGTDSLV